MDVYYVRHGESTNNNGDTHDPDPALTDVGHAQASHAAAALEGVRATGLYCSPLRRNLQTARAIGEALGLTPHVVPGLCEIGGISPHDYGAGRLEERSGMSRDGIRDICPGATLSDEITDEGWWFLRREVLDADDPAVWKHAVAGVKSVGATLMAERNGADDVTVVVGHGASGWLFFETFLGIEPTVGQQRFGLDNCSISLFRMRDHGIRLAYSNRVAHLPLELQESERAKLRASAG
jgi:broad specificity phosphatase PhoE